MTTLISWYHPESLDYHDGFPKLTKYFISREFADHFNQALNFRIGSVAELLEDLEMCGGASEDYYFSTQVDYTGFRLACLGIFISEWRSVVLQIVPTI